MSCMTRHYANEFVIPFDFEMKTKRTVQYIPSGFWAVWSSY